MVWFLLNTLAMKYCKISTLVSLAVLLLATQGIASDIYVAQTSQGVDTGTNAANAHSVAWFNSPVNWGSGSTQIGPGCTVHLCGVVTNSVTFQTGGVAGNPITLLFEPNAKISAPTWTGNIISGASCITIDGGSNGVIEATSNGTGLAYSNNCVGIYAVCANNLTIRNLAIRNLYVRTKGGEQNGSGVAVINLPTSPPYGYTNMVVTNCVFHDMYIGVSSCYGIGGCANIYVEGCTITNINWGIQCGDVAANSICDKVYIQNNTIGYFSCWDDTAFDSFHHNAAYCWAQLGSAFYHCTISGNTVLGYGTYNTSGFYFSGNTGSTIGMVGPVSIYNNIFNDQNGNPANGSIFFLPNAGFSAIVANNDFLGDAWNVGLDWDGVYGGTQTVSYYNNIVSNSMALAIYDSASVVLASDHNSLTQPPGLTDWFSMSANNSAALQSLSYWQGNGYDLHSAVNSLNFNGNFVPQSGSALIGTGTNLYSIFTTDYSGNPRPGTGAWTIGANEPAAVQIVPPPTAAISVTPASQYFGVVAVGATTNNTFTVQNTGGGTLAGSASVAAPFSIVSGGSYNLGAGQSQTVTVSYNPTSVGTNSQVVTFTGAGGASVVVSGTTFTPPPVTANLTFQAGDGVITAPFVLTNGAVRADRRPGHGWSGCLHIHHYQRRHICHSSAGQCAHWCKQFILRERGRPANRSNRHLGYPSCCGVSTADCKLAGERHRLGQSICARSFHSFGGCASIDHLRSGDEHSITKPGHFILSGTTSKLANCSNITLT
jgi:hypothetical protein